DVPPIGLRLGMHLRIAVYLGSGREQEPRTFCLGKAERLMTAEGADLERLDGQLEIVDGARGRSKVEHAIEGPLDIEIVGDIVLDEPKPVVPHQVSYVLRAARDEVVRADDVMAVRDETIGEVRPQKTCRSGNQDSHGRVPIP